MDIAETRAFLDDQVPPKHQVLLPPVFRSAYAVVSLDISQRKRAKPVFFG